MAQSSFLTDDTALMYAVIGVMGTVNGLHAGVVGYYIDTSILKLHAAIWLFLIGWAVSTAYLSYKRVPSGVVAVGLYFVSLVLVLHPVVIYGPLLVAAKDAPAPERAQLLVHGWQGILTWGVVAGGLAIAIVFSSRLFERRARRVLLRRRRTFLDDANER